MAKKKKSKSNSKSKFKPSKKSSPMMKLNAVLVGLAFLVYAYIVYTGQ